MTFQEKRSLVTLFSMLAIPAIYFWYIYSVYLTGHVDMVNDLRFWAKAILILIPIQIVTTIINHIVFAIFNRIINNEKESYKQDERDKMIELRATRNSYMMFMIGYLTALVVLVLGAPLYMMFVVLILAGMLSSVVNSLTEFYFYRRGF